MHYPMTKDWTGHYSPNTGLDYSFHINTYQVQSLPAHRHEYLELSLVLEGEGFQHINGTQYPMKPGTFTLLLPYHIHKITPTAGPIHLYNCMFDLGFLFQASKIHSGLGGAPVLHEELPPTLHLDESNYQFFKALLDDTLHEYQEQNTWRSDLLRIKLMEILIRFDRLRRLEKSDQLFSIPNHNTNMWAIISYVYSHFHEPLTLSMLSEHFHLSGPYLSSAFKKYTGLSFVQFLNEVRIRQASSLLVSSNMSSIDIAIDVGFTSQQSFIRSFRKIKGMTPNEYRKAHQQK